MKTSVAGTEFVKAGQLHLELDAVGDVCSARITLFNDLVTFGGDNLGRHVNVDVGLLKGRVDKGFFQGDIALQQDLNGYLLNLMRFCPIPSGVVKNMYIATGRFDFTLSQ